MTAPTQPSTPNPTPVTGLSAEFWQNTVFKYLEEGFVPNADCSVADLKEKINKLLTQTREETLEVVRKAFHEGYHDDRWMFLNYCLVGWAESGHGAPEGFVAVEWDPGLDNHDLANTPGLVPGTKRRPATGVFIAVADEYLDASAVVSILETPDNHGNPDADYPVFKVTHELVERGLKRIRLAHNIPDQGSGNWECNLTSVPHLSQGQRNAILKADLTNDASLLDAYDYAAIIEIGMFNEVRYC